MAQPSVPHPFDGSSFPKLPKWVQSDRDGNLEETSYFAGACLAILHQVLARADVPHALLRDRLALASAAACMAYAGRAEKAADLRDEVLLLRPGDRPGPAGAIYLRWREAVKTPLTAKALGRVFPDLDAGDLARSLKAGGATPVASAAHALETMLDLSPRGEVDALMLADAVLAKALGWDRIVPLLASGLRPRDLGLEGDDLRLACTRALIRSADGAISLAADVTRRVRRLGEVAPKLRAKAAGSGLQLFRTHDAATPAALTGVMSDRAARRFCDRLVDLGAVRELTGRDSFRIYGV